MARDLSFEKGHQFPFPNDGTTQSRVTAHAVRDAIVQTGEYFDGEAIFIPTAEKLARHIGVTSTSLTKRSKGPKGFVATIQHVTGLVAMRREGLFLYDGDNSEVEPLFNHDIQQPPVPLNPSEIEEREKRINDLARDLPPQIMMQLASQFETEARARQDLA